MSRHRAIGIAVVLVACAGTLSASQKPNFSGTWVIQQPAKAAGQEQVVKQDEKTLTMTSGGRTSVYDLSGVEKREVIPMRGAEVVMLSKAVWEGNTLVITTTTDYPNKMKTVARETWSLDAQGHLVIDATETLAGQPNQPPHTVKVVLAKKN